VGLVDDPQNAVAAGDLAHRVEIAGFGHHDADVGQGRLHQQAGDVTLGQPAVETDQVVELDDGRGQRDVHLGPMEPGRGTTRSPSRTANVSSTVSW
jgi:hypothetical protein